LEAEEEAEEVMERMREQSLLTDVSEQVLIRNNVVAKVFGKLEYMDNVFDRCIRTAEMPPIPGAEDESKWHMLTKMASVSQLKETMVDEEGNMIFKKLDLLTQKQILGFIVQRSWDKLQYVVREGEYNAASSIQGRVRGWLSRALLKRVKEEAARQVREILESEDKKKYLAKVEAVTSTCHGWSKVKIAGVGVNWVEVRLSDSLLEVGREMGKLGFKVIPVVNEGVGEDEGEICLWVSLVEGSKEDGENGVHTGDEGARVEGLVPNKAYRVRMQWGNRRVWEDMFNAMAAKREGLMEGLRLEIEAVIEERVKVETEGLETEVAEIAEKTKKPLESVERVAKRVEKEVEKARGLHAKAVREEVMKVWAKGLDGPKLLEDETKADVWTSLVKLKWMAAQGTSVKEREDEEAFNDLGWKECWTRPDVPAQCFGTRGDFVWIMVTTAVEDEARKGKDWLVAKKKHVSLLDLGANRRVPRVVVRWEEPRNNGWGIVCYKVERRLQKDGVWEVMGKSKVAEFVDLIDIAVGRSGLELEYRVSAVNKLGEGNCSEVALVRIEQMGGLGAYGSEGGAEVEDEEEEEEAAVRYEAEVFSPPPKVIPAAVDVCGGTLISMGGIDFSKLQSSKKRKIKRK
jgi:hypothetical protein